MPVHRARVKKTLTDWLQLTTVERNMVLVSWVDIFPTTGHHVASDHLCVEFRIWRTRSLFTAEEGASGLWSWMHLRFKKLIFNFLWQPIKFWKQIEPLLAPPGALCVMMRQCWSRALLVFFPRQRRRWRKSVKSGEVSIILSLIVKVWNLWNWKFGSW